MWTPDRIAQNAKSTEPPRALRSPSPTPVDDRSYLKPRKLPFEPAIVAITEPLGVGVYVDGRLMGQTPLASPLSGDHRQHTVVLKGPGLVDQRHEVRADPQGRFYVFARMQPVDARR